MILNMGPQHPSTHGVLRVILKLDGETVIDLDCDIGFLHRGMEKIAENRQYPMIAPYWDRLDYLAAVSNGLVWAETGRKMLGLQFAARLPCHAWRIGGMPNDAYDDFEKDVRQFVNNFPKRIDEYETVLSENRIWLSRTVGIGVISGPEAIAIGLSGPALRGSGVAWDVRKSRPYAAYADMDFDVPLGENGDTYDRY